MLRAVEMITVVNVPCPIAPRHHHEKFALRETLDHNVSQRSGVGQLARDRLIEKASPHGQLARRARGRVDGRRGGFAGLRRHHHYALPIALCPEDRSGKLLRLSANSSSRPCSIGLTDRPLAIPRLDTSRRLTAWLGWSDSNWGIRRDQNRRVLSQNSCQFGRNGAAETVRVGAAALPTCSCGKDFAWHCGGARVKSMAAGLFNIPGW
jgi:hypothetical protein